MDDMMTLMRGMAPASLAISFFLVYSAWRVMHVIWRIPHRAGFTA